MPKRRATNDMARRVVWKFLGASTALLPFVIWWHFSTEGNRAIKSIPGMAPVVDSNDIYSEARPGKLSPAVRGFPNLVYVPNSSSNTVDVIDAHSFRVVNHFRVGHQPQHVTPSYDLRTLWVLNDLGDSLTRIDPATGAKRETIPVKDPYNMYFTPDGKFAVVIAERTSHLDFRDPNTMALVDSVPVPCRGLDHIDFSADGSFLIASCEFSGTLIKLDVARRAVVATLALDRNRYSGTMQRTALMGPGMSMLTNRRAYDHRYAPTGSMPQDIKTSPDGKVFYVADMLANGVHIIDARRFVDIGFVPTGLGAHGLYVSRDSRLLYCSNRDEGTVSLISFATRKVVQTWIIHGKASPDMGGVSADGRILWLSGRYNGEVYAINTADGRLLARIPVGKGPHGLCVYPQPGRFSLGHTGILR